MWYLCLCLICLWMYCSECKANTWGNLWTVACPVCEFGSSPNNGSSTTQTKEDIRHGTHHHDRPDADGDSSGHVPQAGAATDACHTQRVRTDNDVHLLWIFYACLGCQCSLLGHILSYLNTFYILTLQSFWLNANFMLTQFAYIKSCQEISHVL